MCIFIRLSSIIHKKFTSTVRRKWGCWLKRWRNVGFCPPPSFLLSELVWKFPSKNDIVGRKNLFLTRRCVDKRGRKLGVGNKLAEPIAIHLTWLKAPDSCFHRECAPEATRGSPSLQQRAASANMTASMLILTKIEVAFYSWRRIYLPIWPSQVHEVGISFRMRKLRVREVNDLSKANQLVRNRPGPEPKFSPAFHVLYILSS